MKLLLIKIGKVWSVIRRDGLIRGGRRVLSAITALFRPVPPGDILLITGGVGDSARYRTAHVAEELRLQGFRVSITVQDNPFLVSYADRFSVFVFHRVLFTDRVRCLMERVKAGRKEMIFETDDLVFDPEYLKHMDYYRVMNPLERQLYEHGVGGEILADPYVEVATTTTHFLAEKLRERGKQAFVVPNKLSQEDLRWAEEIRSGQASSFKFQASRLVRIGYLSGTPSHNKDFATIVEPLRKILDKYSEARLVLAGPLDTGHALEAYRDRIETVPYQPRRDFFKLVATLDINVAPLEIGNPFCESKSELKFFEAGIVGVPTVAAATDTYERAITDGVDGFVAGNTDEWVTKLEQLITDPSLRERMGRAARETALTKYSNLHANSREYYDYLKSKITK